MIRDLFKLAGKRKFKLAFASIYMLSHVVFQ